MASTLSLIGAIVAEYFGGSASVLGRMVVQSSSALKFDITWAAVSLAAVAGIVFYLVIALVERLVIPWHARRATRAEPRPDARSAAVAHCEPFRRQPPDSVSFRRPAA